MSTQPKAKKKSGFIVSLHFTSLSFLLSLRKLIVIQMCAQISDGKADIGEEGLGDIADVYTVREQSFPGDRLKLDPKWRPKP